jgi:hypothetical protein
MAAGSLESRLSNLEELAIIVIIWVFGGRVHGPGPGPIPDPGPADISRIEALMRRIPRGDSIPVDIARMSLEVAEARLLEVNAELTRLRAHEAELNARLKELRRTK